MAYSNYHGNRRAPAATAGSQQMPIGQKSSEASSSLVGSERDMWEEIKELDEFVGDSNVTSEEPSLINFGIVGMLSCSILLTLFLFCMKNINSHLLMYVFCV
jgi:hypothetical protein